jgi:hypothetical protein
MGRIARRANTKRRDVVMAAMGVISCSSSALSRREGLNVIHPGETAAWFLLTVFVN